MDLLYTCDLFIGYTCESSILVVSQSSTQQAFLLDRNGWTEAILSARNVVWQKLLIYCFTDSLWSRCYKKECYFLQYLREPVWPSGKALGW